MEASGPTGHQCCMFMPFKYWTEGALSYTSEEIGSVRPVDGKYLIMWSQQDMLHYLGTTNKCVVLYCVVLCCVCVAPRGCDNSWTRSHCMPCLFFRQSKPELDWCVPIFESIVCDSQQTASKGDPGRACVCVRFVCMSAFFCMYARLSLRRWGEQTDPCRNMTLC